MAGGIHVEVSVTDTQPCQVAPHSNRDGKTVTSVSKHRSLADDGTMIEEFTLTSGREHVEPDGGQAVAYDDPEKLYEGGEKQVYRFERETPQHCVCERVESHSCPIREVEAVNGTLYVTFIAPDHARLQSVLEELAGAYDQMSVCRLLQSEEDCGTRQLTLVDIGALTEKQRDVLSTAHEMGYFAYPQEASAADIADALGIASSTFTEHLAAAQRNLLEEVLDGNHASAQ